MSLARSAAAIAVHAYTASGALLGWLALRSAWDHDPRAALLWLSLAVFVDATDGFAARAVDVRRHASWIDGARLDDIVDFLTYVFVPLAILWDQHLLGGVSGLIAVGAVLIASGLGFSNLHAKTLDHFFTGWPSYWNLVAVYCLAWRLSQATTTVLLIVPRSPGVRAPQVRLSVAHGDPDAHDAGARRHLGDPDGADDLVAADRARLAPLDQPDLPDLLLRALALAQPPPPRRSSRLIRPCEAGL